MPEPSVALQLAFGWERPGSCDRRSRPTPALVAQRIEHRPPEPCAQVRVLPGALQRGKGWNSGSAQSPGQTGGGEAMLGRGGPGAWPVTSVTGPAGRRAGIPPSPTRIRRHRSGSDGHCPRRVRRQRESGALQCQFLDHGTGYPVAVHAPDGLRRQALTEGTHLTSFIGR